MKAKFKLFPTPLYLACEIIGLREQLGYVWFKDGYIWATDAHMAIKISMEHYGIPTEFIYNLEGKMLSLHQMQKICCKTGFMVSPEGIWDTINDCVYRFRTIVEGRPLPDMIQEILDKKTENEPLTEISLNPNLLTKVSKIFGYSVLNLSFTNKSNKIICIPNTDMEGYLALVMPAMSLYKD